MDSTENNRDYYLDRREMYWKQLGRFFRSFNKILPQYLDTSAVENIAEGTRKEFEALLSKLPYIGGGENMNTFMFVSSAAGLAYIRVLERYDLSVEVVGKIFNEVYNDVYASLPGILRWFIKWRQFSSKRKKKLQAFAEETQKRQYPGNWVMEFVEGDGNDFDYAVNYTECAVLKFFRDMGAEIYMPYLCVLDLTESKVLRSGLHRQTTLFYGGDCCDFQYKKNRSSLPGLPLDELPEYKNRKK